MNAIIFLLAASLFQVSLATFSWDSQCGVTKGCFPACQDGCKFLVTWQATASGVDFVLKAEETVADVYLAIGFSNDRRMGDDSVNFCVVPGSTVLSGYNVGMKNELLNPNTMGVSSASVQQVNGVITCSFTRSFTGTDSRFYNLNDDYILLLVVGELGSAGSGGYGGSSYRMRHHHKIPWNSDGKVDFNSNKIVELYKLNSPLVKLHGIMMVLAWMFFSSVGILIARYNKDMLDPRQLFGTKYWFQFHRASMIAVLTFVIIGFIAIFVEIRGYSQIIAVADKAVTDKHPIFGIIVTVLTIMNPIAGLLRPSQDHRYRWIFNWVHFGAGVTAFIFAVITIFFGHLTARSKLPTSAMYVTSVHVVVVVVTIVALEIHKCVSKNRKEAVVDSIGLQEDGSKVEIKGDESKATTPSKVPLYVLLAFIVVEFGVAIGVLSIIAAS